MPPIFGISVKIWDDDLNCQMGTSTQKRATQQTHHIDGLLRSKSGFRPRTNQWDKENTNEPGPDFCRIAQWEEHGGPQELTNALVPHSAAGFLLVNFLLRSVTPPMPTSHVEGQWSEGFQQHLPTKIWDINGYHEDIMRISWVYHEDIIGSLEAMMIWLIVPKIVWDNDASGSCKTSIAELIG